MSKNPLPQDESPSTPLDEKEKNKDDFWLGVVLCIYLLIAGGLLSSIIANKIFLDPSYYNSTGEDGGRLYLIYLPPIVLVVGAIVIALYKGRGNIAGGIVAFIGLLFGCGLLAGVLLPALCFGI